MIKPKKTIIKDAIESSKEEKYSISFNLLSVALASVSIAFSEAGGHKYAPWCFIAIALLLLLFSFFVLKRKNNKKYIWILLICTSTLVIALIAFSLNKMYKASKTSGEADNKMESAVINTITPTPTTKIIKYAAEETPSLNILLMSIQQRSLSLLAITFIKPKCMIRQLSAIYQIK